MSKLSEIWRRVGMLVRGEGFAHELEEEMRLHKDLKEQELVAHGVDASEARYAANRQFGNAMNLRERGSQAWGWEWIEHFMQDVNYGVRGMLRSPGTTLVALLSLALGIGANTAIFSLTDAVMLKSLPVKDPAGLVLFGSGLDQGISDGFPNPELYSYPFYREMQKRNQVFSDVAASFSMIDHVHGFIEGQSEAEAMNIQLVSGTYFPMLGVHAAAGRMLSEEDDRKKGERPVAVVSYAWWTHSLARDAAQPGDHTSRIAVTRPGDWREYRHL